MRVLVLPGDGIGPEISAAAVEVLDLVDRRLSLALSLETQEVGLTRLKRDGTTLPPAVLQAARTADGIVSDQFPTWTIRHASTAASTFRPS